jgi:hypothetical protein
MRLAAARPKTASPTGNAAMSASAADETSRPMLRMTTLGPPLLLPKPRARAGACALDPASDPPSSPAQNAAQP